MIPVSRRRRGFNQAAFNVKAFNAVGGDPWYIEAMTWVYGRQRADVRVAAFDAANGAVLAVATSNDQGKVHLEMSRPFQIATLVAFSPLSNTTVALADIRAELGFPDLPSSIPGRAEFDGPLVIQGAAKNYYEPVRNASIGIYRQTDLAFAALAVSDGDGRYSARGAVADTEYCVIAFGAIPVALAGVVGVVGEYV